MLDRVHVAHCSYLRARVFFETGQLVAKTPMVGAGSSRRGRRDVRAAEKKVKTWPVDAVTKREDIYLRLYRYNVDTLLTVMQQQMTHQGAHIAIAARRNRRRDMATQAQRAPRL